MCETIKDAGDDPDATHKARIQSTVRFIEKPGYPFRWWNRCRACNESRSYQYLLVKRRLIRYREK